MKQILSVILFMLIFFTQVFAYKTFSYDQDGNRVYKTVEQKDFSKYKNKKRRAYVRTPRTNWEVTDSMRVKKRTYNELRYKQ